MRPIIRCLVGGDEFRDGLGDMGGRGTGGGGGGFRAMQN